MTNHTKSNKDMEQLKFSCTILGKLKEYNHFEKQFGKFLKC